MFVLGSLARYSNYQRRQVGCRVLAKLFSKESVSPSTISLSRNKMTSVQVAKPVLYSYWRSSCSWRVRIALNLKEISYDIKTVSLIKNGGEQHSDEYREINPMEQLPALVINDNTYIDSLAIMQYLEENYLDHPLLPADVHSKTKVREICQLIASGIQPLQNLAVLIYVGDEKKKEWACHWMTRGFRAVEKMLSATAGKYCVGDEITMADCCLVPQVFNARRFQVDLRPFPNVVRIDRELESHPAFIGAHPNNQPDCPPEAPK
ncbi:probable maleylacetoacetate isomerase 2 [Neocloeon triangulifer]|uniref:probable maleylacetoacetate isomerase 2 n=1 Tax=Neocloeon triangulifer TaxID=2078957 RepID=UPI00286F0B63|nr:probable maleylacetoacetate isomerase 2 [Neocloeon triangulifer]